MNGADLVDNHIREGEKSQRKPKPRLPMYGLNKNTTDQI